MSDRILEKQAAPCNSSRRNEAPRDDVGSPENDELVEVEVAASLLKLSVSELECRAACGLPPKPVSTRPLTYSKDELVDYGCQKWRSNLNFERIGSRSFASQNPAANTSYQYRQFIRQYDDAVPHASTHAITITFERQKQDHWVGASTAQFNEEIGDVLRDKTWLAMAQTLRGFAKIHSLKGKRARSEYPFWLQGERYSKHGVSEVDLHLHGCLFVSPQALPNFNSRQPAFEGRLMSAFEKCFGMPIDFKIEENDSGWRNYPLKHLSKDVRAFEWFITNIEP